MAPFTPINTHILKSTELNCTEKVMLGIICSYCYGDKTECFPSQKTLAGDIQKSLTTVQDTLKSLIEKGFLSVTRRLFGNVYHLTEKTTGECNPNLTHPKNRVSEDPKNRVSIKENEENKIEENKPSQTAASEVQPVASPITDDQSVICGGGVFESEQKEPEPITSSRISIPSVLKGITASIHKLIRGLNSEDAQHLIDETGAQVERHEERGNPIKNIGGYFAAIVRRFKSGEFTDGIIAQRKAEEEAARQKEEARRLAKEAEEREEKAKQAAADEREKRVQSVVSKLTDEEMKDWRERYIEDLRINSSFMYNHWKPNGFSSPMFEPMMFTWIYETVTGTKLDEESPAT